MSGQHYFRTLVINRIVADRTVGKTHPAIKPGVELAGHLDRMRFRRMAEVRKRQMLERLLLNEEPDAAPHPITAERRTPDDDRPHDPDSDYR